MKTEKKTEHPFWTALNVLFLVFFALKMFDVIKWSWWWVTAPLWGKLLLYFGLWAFLAMKHKMGQLTADQERVFIEAENSLLEEADDIVKKIRRH